MGHKPPRRALIAVSAFSIDSLLKCSYFRTIGLLPRLTETISKSDLGYQRAQPVQFATSAIRPEADIAFRVMFVGQGLRLLRRQHNLKLLVV
jgi:hypothetical protein